MPFPFEVDFQEITRNIDLYIDEVFSCLESEFLVMPKGPGFVEFPVFEAGYEALERATRGFRDVTPETVSAAVYQRPIALIVLRCILGFTPPEWACYASRHGGVEIGQGAARTIDRKIRMRPSEPLKRSQGVTDSRIRALIEADCHILQSGAPAISADRLHRIDKADTAAGLVGVRSFADLGAPDSVLLYERFLGRPFAGHRDSISELVGNIVENAIEDVLTRAGISYRKTKRAERLPGFDQAPDFVIPNELNPQVVIEAKLTEDDGTARDKVSRVQHLGALSTAGQPPDQPKLEVVACIAGRGFGVRREDMKKLILGDAGQGLHPTEHAPVCCSDAVAGVPFALVVGTQRRRAGGDGSLQDLDPAVLLPPMRVQQCENWRCAAGAVPDTTVAKIRGAWIIGRDWPRNPTARAIDEPWPCERSPFESATRLHALTRPRHLNSAESSMRS